MFLVSKAMIGVISGDGDLFIEFKDRRFEIKPCGIGPKLLWEIIELFDGNRSNAEVAEIAEVDLRSVDDLIDQLICLDLIQKSNSNALGLIESKVFIENFNLSARMYKSHVLRRKLFFDLLDKDCNIEILQGLLLETYHYIGFSEKAIRLAQLSYANTTAQDIANYLASSEAGHQSLIISCLKATGLDHASIVKSDPLSSTVAIGSFIISSVFNSPEEFFSLFCLSEARSDEKDGALAYLDQIECNFGLSSGSLDGLRSHIGDDLDAEHSDVLGKYLTGESHISEVRCDAAVKAIHNLKHLYDDWYDQILTRYSRKPLIINVLRGYRAIA